MGEGGGVSLYRYPYILKSWENEKLAVGLAPPHSNLYNKPTIDYYHPHNHIKTSSLFNITRSTRNKKLSNKYNDIIIKIVADAIKERRKSKKSINLTSKTTFKKLIYIEPSNIDDFSPSSTSKLIYIINTSVL